MRTLGDDVYIQRGETWSLDFDVTNKKGDPYMMLKEWNNPYLAITVTAARYEQEGDFRKTWWLDLSERWVEKADGSMEIAPMKKFVSTEALNIHLFSVNEVIGLYGTNAGGRIVLDPTSDFDVTNFLFFTDPLSDGNKVYKYVKSYEMGHVCQIVPTYYDASIDTYPQGAIINYLGILYYVLQDADNTKIPGLDTDYFLECKGYNDFMQVTKNVADVTPVSGIFVWDTVNETLKIFVSGAWRDVSSTYWLDYGNSIISEEWEEYSFRVIKQFVTRDWVEQGYLFDMKVLAGESLQEYVHAYLSQDPNIEVPDLPWTDEQLQEQINSINDEEERAYVQEIYDSGMPLMPDYDTKALILQPTRLFVSANIQGRY